jgi:prophage DNA circulation protein
MIISDLNHLQEVYETSVLGGIAPNYVVDVRCFMESVNINKYISGVANVSGNLAFAEADAVAFGPNSLANALTQTYTDACSSIATATSASATDDYYYWFC